MDFFENILGKIKEESQKRGLKTSILAKQTRLRVVFLDELFEKDNKTPLSIPQIRQIQKLAEFLKIDFDKKTWKKEFNLLFLSQNLSLLDDKKIDFKTLLSKDIFYIFTFSNFNAFLVSIVTLIVIILVGLPIFLVVRPAEVIWYSQNVNNDIIKLNSELASIKGTTKRAKSMIFGGENITLKNGDFILELPKPDTVVIVPLTLTNYFNLTTDYQIVIKPTN